MEISQSLALERLSGHFGLIDSSVLEFLGFMQVREATQTSLVMARYFVASGIASRLVETTRADRAEARHCRQWSVLARWWSLGHAVQAWRQVSRSMLCTRDQRVRLANENDALA